MGLADYGQFVYDGNLTRKFAPIMRAKPQTGKESETQIKMAHEILLTESQSTKNLDKASGMVPFVWVSATFANGEFALYLASRLFTTCSSSFAIHQPPIGIPHFRQECLSDLHQYRTQQLHMNLRKLRSTCALTSSAGVLVCLIQAKQCELIWAVGVVRALSLRTFLKT